MLNKRRKKKKTLLTSNTSTLVHFDDVQPESYWDLVRSESIPNITKHTCTFWPVLFLEDDDDSLSGLLFFFLEDPEASDVADLFSTAGLDRALFLKSSRSFSRAGSILHKSQHKQLFDWCQCYKWWKWIIYIQWHYKCCWQFNKKITIIKDLHN